MNKDKLARLQAQVRTGGKGSVRRKKKAVHKTTTTGTKESLPRHSVIPPDAPPKSCSAPPPSFLGGDNAPATRHISCLYGPPAHSGGPGQMTSGCRTR
jgi:hypothetical protein